MSDEEGLSRAYKTDKGVYIFGDRMYIAGTRTLKDWIEVAKYIPAWGDSKNLTRYQYAKCASISHPEVKNLTGHSMGGTVALQLDKDYAGINGTRTYGAPVLDLHTGAFDLNANTSYGHTSLNPKSNHPYTTLGKDFYTVKSVPVESTNADGSKSLIA